MPLTDADALTDHGRAQKQKSRLAGTVERAKGADDFDAAGQSGMSKDGEGRDDRKGGGVGRLRGAWNRVREKCSRGKNTRSSEARTSYA